MHSLIALLSSEVYFDNLKGWSRQYRTDKETKAFVNMLMRLALLPPEGISDGWKFLSTMARSVSARRLLDYYKKVWMNQWTPAQISVFKRRIRTNNDLEGL